MNFQRLIEVRNADFFLETAFSRARKISSNKTYSAKGVESTKLKVITKIRIVEKELTAMLQAITTSFPNLDALPEFYDELMRLTLNRQQFKDALGSIGLSVNKIRHLGTIYSRNIRDAKSEDSIKKLEKQFYGRIASVLKSNQKKFAFVESCRRTLKDFPDMKTDLYTVCIVGFPNTGKSTLLSKITSARPKIGDYAFTTKTLNTGYTKKRYDEIQIIDSPGTLARLDKMNNVEKQSYLAVKYLSHLVVFVYDLSQQYNIQQQEDLIKIIEGLGKPVYFYLSKTDILDNNVIDEFLKSHGKLDRKIFTSADNLKEAILKKSDEY